MTFKSTYIDVIFNWKIQLTHKSSEDIIKTEGVKANLAIAITLFMKTGCMWIEHCGCNILINLKEDKIVLSIDRILKIFRMG